MKRLLTAISGIAVIYALSACSDCSIVEDKGNPQRQFRLEDENGNSLWFGSTAIYNPEDAVFEHPTQGVLATTVNSGSQSVGVMVPLTDQEEVTMTLTLDSVTTSQLMYTAFMFEEKCKRTYELSYIFQDSEKICTLCGSTQFENDGYIYLNP